MNRSYSKRKGKRPQNLIRRQRIPIPPNARVNTSHIIDDGVFLSSNASGNLANVITIDPSTANVNWTSWTALYKQFRVNYVSIHLTPISNIDGITMFYLDETSSATPTLAIMQAANSTSLVNSTAAAPKIKADGYVFSGYRMTTRVPQWLSGNNPWNPTSLAGNVLYLKSYTDLANLATPISKQLWQIRIVYSVSFKGQQ